MEFVVILFSFFLGLGIGSFLYVVVLRGNRKETFGGRSYCETCKHTLSSLELIPLISFVLQKGRCRHCGIVLSLEYPIIEITTGVLYAVATWLVLSQSQYLLDIRGVLLLVLSWIAISAAVVVIVADTKYYTIPNGAVFILLLLGITLTLYRAHIFQTPDYPKLIWDSAAALILSLLLAGMWLFSRGTWMGFGDVKLILVTSLMVGFPASLVAFLFSFWTGALVALMVLALRRKKLRDHIPFGPFIILGTLLAFFLTNLFLNITGFWAIL